MNNSHKDRIQNIPTKHTHVSTFNSYLQLFVCQVDAQLFKTVCCKALETKNIENTHCSITLRITNMSHQNEIQKIDLGRGERKERQRQRQRQERQKQRGTKVRSVDQITNSHQQQFKTKQEKYTTRT